MTKFFTDHDSAYEYMRSLNRTHLKEIYCLVDGPEDNFAVVDLKTAIELDMPYEWSAR
jgi:hypothetical protein